MTITKLSRNVSAIRPTANPELTGLINETIGTDWHKNLYGLKSPEPFANDKSFLDRWRKTQEASNGRLAAYIKETMSIDVDPASMFDVQVKRLHEYKRQLLNALPTSSPWPTPETTATMPVPTPPLLSRSCLRSLCSYRPQSTAAHRRCHIMRIVAGWGTGPPVVHMLSYERIISV